MLLWISSFFRDCVIVNSELNLAGFIIKVLIKGLWWDLWANKGIVFIHQNQYIIYSIWVFLLLCIIIIYTAAKWSIVSAWSDIKHNDYLQEWKIESIWKQQVKVVLEVLCSSWSNSGIKDSLLKVWKNRES